MINNTAKLNPLNDKVKFCDHRLFTVELTFFYFFLLFTYCGFSFLCIFGYTKTQNTTIMKNQVQKANEPKDIVYRITIQEGAFVTTEDYTFKRIFFNNKKEGDDFEFMYSIQSYYWEQMMKMELNESIFFSPDRNDNASKGIIVRIV